MVDRDSKRSVDWAFLILCGGALLLGAWLVLALIAGFPRPAHAETIAEWFKSLRQPGTGMGCCDMSDCKVTRARMRPDGIWLAIDTAGKEVEIPPDKIIEGKEHPGAQAVLCGYPGTIYCFVRPGSSG